MDMKMEEMLKQLMAVDFMSVDLQLYLDTHPNDMQALERYNQSVMLGKMLRENYECQYGPVTSFRSPSSYPWQWISNPWPWQYRFNAVYQREV